MTTTYKFFDKEKVLKTELEKRLTKPVVREVREHSAGHVEVDFNIPFGKISAKIESDLNKLGYTFKIHKL